MTSVLLHSHSAVDPLGRLAGIGRYVEQLTEAMERQGSDRWSFDLSSTREPGEPVWQPANVGYRQVPGPRRAVHLAWMSVHAPRIERLVGDFDLLHAMHPSFPVPTKKPAVLTIHDVMPLEHPEWFQRHERVGHRRALEYARDNGWWFVADSAHSAAQATALAGIPPDRMTVVHLGIEPAFSDPVPAADVARVAARYDVAPGRYFLAIGGASTRKNTLVLVQALAQTKPVDVPLVLVGRVAPSGARALEEIDRRGVAGRVRVAGFVPDTELRALLAGALALAHPSLDDGFGFPPLEAMAAGVPVIATGTGSLPEIVGDAGLLASPTEPEAWADALGTIATDDALRRRLSAAGLERARQFTWDNAAARTLEVYATAVASQ